ncbi:cathelicidin-1, partial [Lagopus leucura]
MASCWVLVLALLGGACALPAPLGYPQALAQAVDSYNQRPEVQNAFRLLSADPEPGPNVQLSSLHNLNFTIMETRCQARSGAQLDSCEFKEDGLVKDCAAPVVLQGGRAAFDVTCVDSMAD